MSDEKLREHLLSLLRGGGAHSSFNDVITGVPSALRGTQASGVPHTLWQQLEHLRIAQWDILEFSRDPRHVSPSFPEGYWPTSEAPPSDESWDESIENFTADLQAMQDLVADSDTDLFRPIPHGTGQTILREALVVADHNAYHLGQVVLIRRILGAWDR